MSNIQAAQPAAHSVPNNTNGGQPQYIAPIDHVQQIPASAFQQNYPNAERASGYTMQLPHDSQIIQNRIQAGTGNHNVVTVIPGGQQNMSSRMIPAHQMQMMNPNHQRNAAPAQIPTYPTTQQGFYAPYPTMVHPPPFWPYQVPTSEQTQMTSVNQNYMVPVSIMPPPMYAQQQPPNLVQAQLNQSKPREKKILTITNPDSKEVLNEKEISASKTPLTQEEGKSVVQPNQPSTSDSSVQNFNAQFSRAVSNRLLSTSEQTQGTTMESGTSSLDNRSATVTPSADLIDQTNEELHDQKTIADELSIQLNGELEIHEFQINENDESQETIETKENIESHEIMEVDLFRGSKDAEHDGEILLESDSKENESSFIEDLDKKLNDYYVQDKESIDNMVYNKNFLQLIREVVNKLNKNGEFVQPLKTEEELKEMGIDQASMPTVSQSLRSDRLRKDLGNRQDPFRPAFVQDQQTRNLNRPHHPYGGRPSGKKDQRKPPAVISRPSITRQPVAETLRKAENAWKPTAALGKADDKDMKKRKEIRGILNKITPSTFEDLTKEFLGKKLYEDESTLPMIVDLIFDKAVEEPKFVSLYSNLCKIQTDEEIKVSNSTRPFRQTIIKKCQTTFERTSKNATEEAIENTEKDIEEESGKEEKDEKKLKDLQERLEELQGKEKRRMLGTIRFIAELYRHMLITDNIIQWCAIHLIKQYQLMNNDIYIEYVVQLIETVGPIHEKRPNVSKNSTPVSNQNNQLSMPQLLGHLDQLKDRVSTRIRFAIMDLIELKKNNWTPRHGKETGPKTKEQIRNEVVQEELKAEEDRKEYEKKQQQQYRDRDYDQKRKQGYGGRGSLDSRGQVEQKRAQAAQASQATSNLRKDMTLKSALIDSEGGLKKKSWAGGASGGGGGAINTAPEQSKSIPRYQGRVSENVLRESSVQSTSGEQHSRSSTPKPYEHKGPIMSKASSEDPALPESEESSIIIETEPLHEAEETTFDVKD